MDQSWQELIHVAGFNYMSWDLQLINKQDFLNQGNVFVCMWLRGGQGQWRRRSTWNQTLYFLQCLICDSTTSHGTVTWSCCEVQHLCLCSSSQPALHMRMPANLAPALPKPNHLWPTPIPPTTEERAFPKESTLSMEQLMFNLASFLFCRAPTAGKPNKFHGVVWNIPDDDARDQNDSREILMSK